MTTPPSPTNCVDVGALKEERLGREADAAMRREKASREIPVKTVMVGSGADKE